MDGYSDFASCSAVLRAYATAVHTIGVYGYWYSAGFTPAFPQDVLPLNTLVPRQAQPSWP